MCGEGKKRICWGEQVLDLGIYAQWICFQKVVAFQGSVFNTWHLSQKLSDPSQVFYFAHTDTHTHIQIHKMNLYLPTRIDIVDSYVVGLVLKAVISPKSILTSVLKMRELWLPGGYISICLKELQPPSAQSLNSKLWPGFLLKRHTTFFGKHCLIFYGNYMSHLTIKGRQPLCKSPGKWVGESELIPNARPCNWTKRR